jgi:hypothetical protein
MSDLRDRIVHHLTNSFIMDRAVDVSALARDMRREFPGVNELELAQTVRSVALGIGMRIEGAPYGGLAEASCSSCDRDRPRVSD